MRMRLSVQLSGGGYNMPKILVSKSIKEIAKEHDKQIGKDFLDVLDRKVYEYVVKIISNVRFKRLTSKDLL